MRRPSPSGLRRRDSSASRSTQQQNDKSTDVSSYQRGNSGMSRPSNQNPEEEEQKQQFEQQQQIEQLLQQQQLEKQQNYPDFKEKHLSDNFQTIFEPKNIVLTVRYSNDDHYIGIGQYDGQLKIFNAKSQTTQFSLKDNQEIPSACTALRWCPNVGGLNNSLVAAYANGLILYWHTSSQKIMHRYQEKENPINAIDISDDGLKFATGGQDGKVRLYDVGKKSEPVILQKSEAAPEHNNRVYGIKFDKSNPNILISGGWDQMILFWDLRQKQTCNYLYGPKIFSDSFDIQDNLLLTGSWREKNQLELFDMRKMKKLQNIQWTNYTKEEKTPSLVYCCQFSKTNPSQILAGSTGTYELRLFDANQKYECVDIFRNNLEQGVYCLDFAKTSQQAAYGCGDGQFGILNYI